LIPYNKGKLDKKFSDIDNRRAVMKSCSLRNVLVKFPDNAAEIELQWLDESYFDLNLFNNELYFKVCKWIHSYSKFTLAIVWPVEGKMAAKLIRITI
jgi:hypothetical protein